MIHISAEVISDKVADILASTNITKLDVKVATDLTNFPYKGKILDKILKTVSPGVTGVVFFLGFLTCPLVVPHDLIKPHLEKFFTNAANFYLDRPFLSTTVSASTKDKRELKFREQVDYPPYKIDFDPQSKGVLLEDVRISNEIAVKLKTQVHAIASVKGGRGACMEELVTIALLVGLPILAFMIWNKIINWADCVDGNGQLLNL